MEISSFQFASPLLVKADFQMKRPKKPEDDVQIHLIRRIIRDKESDTQAVVELTVQLNKKEDTEREDPCFVAEVTMQSVFKWAPDVDNTLAENLLNVNAPALLLSYIRPIVAQLTGASPLATYNIPFINMN